MMAPACNSSGLGGRWVDHGVQQSPSFHAGLRLPAPSHASYQHTLKPLLHEPSRQWGSLCTTQALQSQLLDTTSQAEPESAKPRRTRRRVKSHPTSVTGAEGQQASHWPKELSTSAGMPQNSSPHQEHLEDESQYGFDFMPLSSLLMAAATQPQDADTWGSTYSGLSGMRLKVVNDRQRPKQSRANVDSRSRQAAVPWGTYVRGRGGPRTARQSSSSEPTHDSVSVAASTSHAQPENSGLPEGATSTTPSHTANSSSSSSSRWMGGWDADNALDKPHQLDSSAGSSRRRKGGYLDDPAARETSRVSSIQQLADGSTTSGDVWSEDWGGYTRAPAVSVQAQPQAFWWQLHVEAAARSAPPEVLRSVSQDTALSPVQEGGAWFKQAGDADTTLFIKGLCSHAPEALMRAALVAAFSQAGEVLQVRLPSLDLGEGARELKGIAFVVFKDAAAKARALAIPPPFVLGRWVKLDAEPGASSYGREARSDAGRLQAGVSKARRSAERDGDVAGLLQDQPAAEGTFRRRGRYLSA